MSSKEKTDRKIGGVAAGPFRTHDPLSAGLALPPW